MWNVKKAIETDFVLFYNNHNDKGINGQVRLHFCVMRLHYMISGKIFG